MEEIEIRDALRRHVTSGEPPLGLSAQRLLSQGRTRQRWRVGLGLGSGCTAAAVLVAGTLTLTPLGGTALDGGPCSLPLAHGYRPLPSSTPDQPRPTGWPTASPWPVESEWPTPSPWPGPTDWPTPTGWPSEYPSMDPLFGGPTEYPSVEPTDGPGPSFHATEPPVYPTDPPPTDGPFRSTLTIAPVPEKVTAAQCYLAKRLQELVPGAKFAPVAAARPFELDGSAGHYAANGIIVKGNAASQLHILIDVAQRPPDAAYDNWERRTVSGRLTRTLNRGDGMLQVEVYSEHSTLIAFMTGDLIDASGLAGLLTAPEMDIA